MYASREKKAPSSDHEPLHVRGHVRLRDGEVPLADRDAVVGEDERRAVLVGRDDARQDRRRGDRRVHELCLGRRRGEREQHVVEPVHAAREVGDGRHEPGVAAPLRGRDLLVDEARATRAWSATPSSSGGVRPNRQSSWQASGVGRVGGAQRAQHPPQQRHELRLHDVVGRRGLPRAQGGMGEARLERERRVASLPHGHPDHLDVRRQLPAENAAAAADRRHREPHVRQLAHEDVAPRADAPGVERIGALGGEERCRLVRVDAQAAASS